MIKRTLSTEGFNTWSFLYWFGELGSILGILYLTLPLQYEIDFIKDFPFFLLFLPLILFYSTWPNFSRLVRSEKSVWFIKSTLFFLLLSFGLAFINFINYEKIDEKYLSRSIEHVYDLKKPKSRYQKRINSLSLVTDIYIVQDTSDQIEPVIFFNNIYKRVYFKDLQKAIIKERNYLAESEYHLQTANLHIDERLLMGEIKPILDELRKADVRKIQFSTGRKYSHYPANYPPFQYTGIPKDLIPRYFQALEAFLDSAEQIDLTKKSIKLSKSTLYLNNSIKKLNRLEITLTADSFSLNGQKIDSLKIERLIYGFIKKYAPNYAIIFNSDDQTTYKKYIEYLDLLYTQVNRLRNEQSYEKYHKAFEDFDWKLDSIKQQYPINIIEWTTEELRLQVLIDN